MTNNRKNIKRNSRIQLLLGLALILLLNVIGSFLFYRLDLTSEKRYSLSPATREMLSKLDDVIYFKVYLEGDFPAGFKRLRNETKEMLDEFNAYNDNIRYEFIDPSAGKDKKASDDLYRQLVESGLNPTDLQVRNNGGTSRQIIFPGAVVTYKNKQLPLDLLATSIGTPAEEQLNNSVQSLEYNLSNVIRKLIVSEKPHIAFIEGQGELDSLHTADIQNALSEYYVVEKVRIDGHLSALTKHIQGKDSTSMHFKNKYKAIIVAGPDSAFSEKDKFIIDQFIMRGGKALWMVDPVYANMDSLQKKDQTIGIANEVNLADLFFNYGVRMNSDLVLDFTALPIPVVTGKMGNQPKTEFLPWYFFPVITPTSQNPIVKNLNAIKLEFAGTLDTLDTPGVKKTILLSTSKYSKVLDAPALISLDLLHQEPDPSQFNQPSQAVAVLLEGNFVSLFLNRVPPEISGAPQIGFVDKSKNTQMIVISDGDIAKNQLRPEQSGISVLPAGFDRFTGQQFGNRDLILNAMNYLCDDSGLLSVRSRELKLRLLDGSKIKDEEFKWQMINVVAPVLLVVLFGIGQFYFRKRRYAVNKK
ncbi:MAG: gliding motility-associated ABC transporter substrate-binding protein GldG [Bacteroidetes bacterium]|nr:gliding motility-associated ABC transporter substrate-binding protein GldG [Bacteroidota bacterium]